MDKVERRLEDVIAIGEPDMYSAGNPGAGDDDDAEGAAGLPAAAAEAASADLGAADQLALAQVGGRARD